jgi:hypothetical protein
MTPQLDRRFFLITASLALALTLFIYKDVFRGQVPFPSFFVFEYPAFVKAAPPHRLQEPANIGDIVTSFYPFHALAARAVKNGEVPLWNPYMLSGTPLLASAQSAIFYPLSVLYYTLPLSYAWSLTFVFRTLLSIIFTAAFVRSVGGTITGSLAAAILFTFCGFLTAWQGQAMSDAAIWLPLICMAVVCLHREPSSRFMAFAAAAFAMPVLAGHPETAAHITLTAVALATFLTIVQPKRSFVLYFLAAGTLSLGVAAVQVLPTTEWLKYVHNSLSNPWPTQPLWSALGWVSRDILHSESSFGLQIPEQASYVGMIAWAAAPLALLHPSRKMVCFLFLWTAIVLSIAYGIGPIFWLSQHIPVLQGIKNLRLIFVGAFAISTLAGLGISAIQRWDSDTLKKYRSRAMLIIFAGSSVAAMMIAVLRMVTTAMSEASRYPRMSAALLVLSCLALLLRLMNRLNGIAFSVAIIAIVCLDSVTFSLGFMPFEDAAFIFPHVELFDRIPKQIEPSRVFQVGDTYLANAHTMYELSSVDGYEICLRRIKEFLGDLSVDDMAAVQFPARRVLDTNDRRIDMLNSKYMIVSQWDPLYREFRKQTDRFRLLYSAGDSDVYENLNSLSAAFVVPANGIEVIPDGSRQLTRLKDPAFDPLKSVVLERPLNETMRSTDTPEISTASPVEWVLRRSGDFELNVRTAAAGVLVISQIFYPGWRAFVDGKPAEVLPADFALTSIPIPPGSHHVRFEFISPAFRIGLLISLFTLTLLVAICVKGRMRYAQ